MKLVNRQARDMAVQRIEYINLVIMSAAAAPFHLPYISERAVTDCRIFAQHLESLGCLMQIHLPDLADAVSGTDKSCGHIADYKSLIANTVKRIDAGDDIKSTIHRHLRNLFVFDRMASGDAVAPHILAIDWLFDTLVRMDQNETLADILGTAQNSEVCTRLCFADAIGELQTWQRDPRLISAGTSSMM